MINGARVLVGIVLASLLVGGCAAATPARSNPTESKTAESSRQPVTAPSSGTAGAEPSAGSTASEPPSATPVSGKDPRAADTNTADTNTADTNTADTNTDCPKKRLLPDGQAVMIDYVDFLQMYGKQYLADWDQPVTGVELGAVVGEVRCSISDLTQDHRSTVIGHFRDGDAAFLATGTKIQAVAGYSPRCRLAARRDGKVRVYLAQRELEGHSAPARCAVAPPSTGTR